MNPYNYTGYQPAYNGAYYQPQPVNTTQYNQVNPTNQWSQPMQPMIQQPMQQPMDEIMGKTVDGIDVVKGINADLSGRPAYYPKADGSEIYCKRINPTTGASAIQIYKLVNAENKQPPEEQLFSAITQLRNDLTNEISDLKNTVLDGLTTPNASASRTPVKGVAK